MKFLAVCVILCVVALAQGYKEFGITTPEELRAESNERIIQGSPAAANQFPHQAYLLITLTSGGRIACGASLISPRWAVTAAHCLKGASSAQMSLGHVNIGSSPVVVTSTNLHVHPNYNANTLNHDIALLGLNSDVPTGANIKPIRIAAANSGTFEGQVATASGFGYISNSGPTSSSLNYVNLKVISNSVCYNSFGSIIIASTICANGITSGAQGVCSGDSGGPLIIGSGDSATLVGVVSFVSGAGCSANYPSGFVRPYHYLSWIQGITGLSREMLV